MVLTSSVLAFGGDSDFAERDPKYKLQPNDVIAIEYVYTPEYNQQVTIQPDGFVTLKLVGGVKVAGLSMDEAQKAIVHKASERLNNPELTLMLKEFVKPHFTIAGEVSKPGSFEMHGNVSALEAIAMGGGFKDTSNRKQVLLVRKVDTEIASVKVVNFKQLMSNSGASEDFQIRPGDILVVPKTKLGAIEPYIRVSSMAMTGLYGVAVLK